MEQLAKKTFKILEFDKILNKLASYTESENVKKRITEMFPFSDIEEARAAQRETTEALITMLKLGSPPVNLSAAEVISPIKRAE